MEIIVCLKQVLDLEKLRIKRETREPVLEGLPLVFGDMDKNALEEGVRIKERYGAKVTALSVDSSPKLKETLIEALAMGADEAVAVIDPIFSGSDAPRSAKALAGAIRRLKYDLILLGEGSADEYSCEIPSRLAELLGLPQITYVRELELIDGGIRAVRDLEEALEVVEAPFPVLLTVTSEINEPRLPSMTDILKASRKPLHEWKAADLSLSDDELGEEALEIISNLAPEQERKNEVFEGDMAEVVDKLVDALIQEGVIRR